MTKVTERTESRVRQFLSEFKLFTGNIQLLFKQNIKEVMLFNLFCSIITVVVTTTMKNLLMRAMMNVSGQTYIVPVNLKTVFTHPMSLIMGITFAVVVMFFSLFQIAGLLHFFSMAQVGRDTNLASMCMAGFRACRKALHPKNWLIIVFVMVLFPLIKVMPLSECHLCDPAAVADGLRFRDQHIRHAGHVVHQGLQKIEKARFRAFH